LGEGALSGKALSLATARPWLVMTTFSPCWTKLTSLSRSDWVCSTVAVMPALNHFTGQSQFRAGDHAPGLNTDVLTTAKFRLADFLKEKRARIPPGPQPRPSQRPGRRSGATAGA